MLSLSNVKAEMAESYYDADDYYSRAASPSVWAGRLAETLGREGAVDRQQFGQLLRGQLPDGRRIHNAGAGRRAGTDLTFSAPKSVSIMALIGNDHRLIAAHQEAVAAALQEAEKLAGARTTVNGVTTQETTGKLLIAQFLHTTNRGTAQSLPDPQLHTHNVLLNLTQKGNGGFRALDNEQLYRHKMLLGALYRAELARRCRALGYDTRRTHRDGRFELGHISREQIQRFSRRTEDIERALAARGLTRDTATAAQKQTAARQTRQAKPAVDHETARRHWRQSAMDADIDLRLPSGRGIHLDKSPAAYAIAALQSSLRHLEERQATFRERDALLHALNQAQGRFGWQELTWALHKLERAGDIVRFDSRIASREAARREQDMLDMAARGKHQVAPLRDPETVRAELAQSGLNAGQQAAAELILTSPDRVNLLQGHAGSGKTTLLEEVHRQATAAGFDVVGLGPTHQAALELTAVLGAGETVAQFQHSAALQASLSEHTLVIVDEGSLLNSQQAHTILAAVEKEGARVAIVGDVHQFKAIEAGKPFAQLQRVCQVARMTKIVRQKDPVLRQAVIEAAEGRMASSLQQLATQVTEIRDAAARFQAISTAYCQVPAADRDQVLILTGTNEARVAINAAVRAQLGLAGAGLTVETLVQRDLTREEKKQLVQYAEGYLLRFHKAYKRMDVAAGELLRVARIHADHLLLTRSDGRTVKCHPNQLSGDKHSVFSLEAREFAVGDRVRVRENDRAAGLINGQQGRVEAIDPRARQVIFRTDAGQQVTLTFDQPRQLEHGYCITGHSAQGATRSGLIYDAAGGPTLSRESWYVNVSRAKDWVQVYTDDQKKLPESISRAAEKTSALELVEAARVQGRQIDL